MGLMSNYYLDVFQQLAPTLLRSAVNANLLIEFVRIHAIISNPQLCMLLTMHAPACS